MATFIGSADTGADVNEPTLTVDRPAAVQSGDVVVFQVTRWNSADSFPAVTAPAGAVLRGQITNDDGGSFANTLIYLLTVDAETEYTFTWSGARWSTVQAQFWRDVDPALDLAAAPFQLAESPAALVFPTVSVTTPAGAGLAWFGNTAAYLADTTHEPPAGYTELVDVSPATAAWAVAGSSGTQSATGATISPDSQISTAALVGLPSPTTPTTITGELDAVLPELTADLHGTLQVDVTAALDAALPAFTAALAGTSDASTGPFITGISGTHLVDENDDPILLKGDTVWSLPVNAGRWNGGDWQGDITAYLATRASQGYNALYIALLGSVQNNGPADTGATFDGVLPWEGSIGTFNEPYWQRVDYILSVAEAHGITVICDYAYSNDLNNAALSGATDQQFTDYGTSLGTRYAARPNLLWGIGGDYFGTWDTELELVLTALRATGDTHPITAQNYPETTSRRDLFTGSPNAFGVDHAQFNWVYTYNPTYDGIEQAWGESPQIPVVWGDGHYDKGSLNGGADRPLMRNLTWWALTSGARGTNLGTELTWGWPADGADAVTSEVFPTVDLPAIRAAFEALPGWHLLLPDTDSSLVTAGRGTHVAPIQAPDEYDETDPQDPYVTAAVTPDGKLAVVYLPVVTTITVDDTEMVPGYTATWIDAVDGTRTSTTPAATYANPGTNSLGDDDWVLVLAAPTSVAGELDAALPPLAGTVTGDVTVAADLAGQLPALVGDAAATVTAAGVIAGQLPALAADLAATVTDPDVPVTGVLAGALPELVGQFTGVIPVNPELIVPLPLMVTALPDLTTVTTIDLTTVTAVPDLTTKTEVPDLATTTRID